MRLVSYRHQGTETFGVVTAGGVVDAGRRLGGRYLLIYTIPVIIGYVTRFTPLAPGDVIATGTPGGVGSRRTPPVWMAKGDEVEVDISGLGVLRNPIVEE